MPSILLLGSGFVAHPTLAYLARRKENQITVACRTQAKAQAFVGDIPNAKAIALDVSDEAALEKAVSQHDLVISLIPYTYHAAVMKAAIKFGKHVCTTSYVNPQMAELEEAAKKAGSICMNEIGVDPGLDHLYAIKTISEVHNEGGKIKSFLSYCGGLPAPEDSNNPLGYKFSWSSRGVLLALRNSAKFYKDGKLVTIDGPDLMDSAKPYFIYPGYAFVCYPNRDSTVYKERYDIPEAETVIRGTLRYQGFPEFVHCLVDMGFLDDTPRDFLNPSEPGMPWKEVVAKVIGAPSSSEADLVKTIVAKHTFKDEDDKKRIINGLKWLHMFSAKPVTPRGNPLDTLCATLEELMQFGEGERDMLILQHKFEIETKEGKKQTRTCTILDYGHPDGYTSMARLVGIPCGVASQQILDGVINTPGVLAPNDMAMCQPLIDDLAKEGIKLEEEIIDEE
ncbi:saccharopine dehydrogenase [Schizosaccharomyces japonicus yFS275]|uniref:Saccharopine dehydrogenase [NADP(+), L-glutamate-forming] n=1 Tax=Schizosaccharomyces japonicus (strain yFS275 / FY16936) TaxID=402676 RepID=B6JXD3_SCHJY|nr:saccharopine dehydrogenase [Schizosaccharomyces japonicus yFS275]EEB06034.1 saccharopine dehydrogenase [Schizosaccharomyces japonicus yFS275]